MCVHKGRVSTRCRRVIPSWEVCAKRERQKGKEKKRWASWVELSSKSCWRPISGRTAGGPNYAAVVVRWLNPQINLICTVFKIVSMCVGIWWMGWATSLPSSAAVCTLKNKQVNGNSTFTRAVTHWWLLLITRYSWNVVEYYSPYW